MAHMMPTYKPTSVVFERGAGMRLFAADGRGYLDFAAGIATLALGHCHPETVAALKAQADKLWHTSNYFRIARQEELAGKLCGASFAEKVFFTNSGTEAIECSLKVARKYFSHIGQPERWRVIAAEGAFHGRSLAACAASGQPKMLDGFGPPTPGFDRVPFGDLAAAAAAVGAETAAILVEPVQGDGGIVPATLDYLRGLRALADRHGLLLILDEIQCGMGRSGKLFAHEWAGIAPDILATAKGLGGGFPLGACLASERAAGGMTYGTHGSTFGGNPLAMAVGNAVVDVILRPDFLPHVDRMARLLWHGLTEVAAAHPGVIREVRGAGLMLGLVAAVPNDLLIEHLLANGLVTVAAAQNVVRLLPPLIVEEADIAEALDILRRTCQGLGRQAA
ncbi:MAG TPA: aspartate aminotransferase family protein [Candidatus Sulfotelmatobacter sp.]|nr:aspartate aminotransferase family protein [Candidatus Sulfotelmatobacter sp.]